MGEWLASRPPQGLTACKRAIKESGDLPVLEALKKETSVFIEMLSRTDTQAIVRAVQARYDEGADTAQAFGISDADVGR